MCYVASWTHRLGVSVACAAIVLLAATPVAGADRASLVRDIAPGGKSSWPYALTQVGRRVFFQASSESARAIELWRSDGTRAGTKFVRGMRRYSNFKLTHVGGDLLFDSYDERHGVELWRSDGTGRGTKLVRDICPGSQSSGVRLLTNVGGKVFFQADDGVHGAELWRSDGTRKGTKLVRDINVGGNKSGPQNLTNVEGELFFNANDGIHGRELWRSDGTAVGTSLVRDIMPGRSASDPRPIANVGGTVFFDAYDGTHGHELWRSDGTAQGTSLVADIYPGPVGSGPWFLSDVHGMLLFNADDGVHGEELWRSDGTAGGTRLVADIWPGRRSSQAGDLHGFANMRSVGKTLFFSANDGTHGVELWSSDGTGSGTRLVREIRLGGGDRQGNSSPDMLTNVAGTLFFRAHDANHGHELWRSDGSRTGTRLVRDLRPGTGSSLQTGESELANVAGTLFFTADDGIHGYELWKAVP